MYFSIYCFLGRFGSYDIQFSAVLGVSALLLILGSEIVFYAFSKEQLSWLNSRVVFIALTIPIVAINYFYFVYNKRFELIKEKMNFSDEKTRFKYSAFGFVLIATVFVVYFI
jgi:divalent metal cation (Fe/Co/Zn/Cd) transporter